jgi:hypothetical protein
VDSIRKPGIQELTDGINWINRNSEKNNRNLWTGLSG